MPFGHGRMIVIVDEVEFLVIFPFTESASARMHVERDCFVVVAAYVSLLSIFQYDCRSMSGMS